MRRRPPQDRPRLPPPTCRAIERVIFGGGTAKVRVVNGIIRVQREEIHLVQENEAREE